MVSGSNYADGGPGTSIRTKTVPHQLLNHSRPFMVVYDRLQRGVSFVRSDRLKVLALTSNLFLLTRYDYGCKLIELIHKFRSALHLLGIPVFQLPPTILEKKLPQSAGSQEIKHNHGSGL